MIQNRLNRFLYSTSIPPKSFRRKFQLAQVFTYNRGNTYYALMYYAWKYKYMYINICRNDGNVSSFLAIFVPRESRYHNRRSGFLVPENFSRKFRKVFRCLTRGAQLNSKHSAACFLSETTLVRKSSLH